MKTLKQELEDFEEREIIKRKAWCEEHGKKCRDCSTTCASRTECYSEWNEEVI